MADWFYMVGEEKTGPVTLKKLYRYADKGKVTTDTLVWTSEFGESWKRFGDVGNSSRLKWAAFSNSGLGVSITWGLIILSGLVSTSPSFRHNAGEFLSRILTMFIPGH